MSFERFTAHINGFRAESENCISLGKSRIGLGTYELPFDYAVIYYDKEIPAIMFQKGTAGDGFKVQKGGHTYYLTAKSFSKMNHIPLGIYKRTTDKAEVFTLISKY